MASEKFNRSADNLGRELRSFLQRSKTVAFIFATVQEVDRDNNTMSVSVGGKVTLPDVNLALVQGGNANALLYPRVGSVVIVGFVEDRPELSFPVAMTEVDDVAIRFDFGTNPPVDSITADSNGVTVVRGFRDAQNNVQFSITGDTVSARIMKDGQATEATLTAGSIALRTPQGSINIDGGQVDINEGHLTVT